jgi:hypothetical protein
MDLKLGNIATEELATKPRQWKFEASLDRTIAGGHGNPSPVEISKFKFCSTGLRNSGRSGDHGIVQLFNRVEHGGGGQKWQSLSTNRTAIRN